MEHDGTSVFKPNITESKAKNANFSMFSEMTVCLQGLFSFALKSFCRHVPWLIGRFLY